MCGQWLGLAAGSMGEAVAVREGPFRDCSLEDLLDCLDKRWGSVPVI